MPFWSGLLQNKTLYKQKRVLRQLAEDDDGCMHELVVMRACRIMVRNICGVQARFIAARKKCRSRARSYWLVIDNAHASILATMAAVVASLMTVEINGRISGACILLVNNYVQAKVTHGKKE
jgi:hypothetical protein